MTKREFIEAVKDRDVEVGTIVYIDEKGRVTLRTYAERDDENQRLAIAVHLPDWIFEE